MGTNGISLVKRNGVYKVAQRGLYDYYPSSAGFNTINFLCSPKFDLEYFKNKIDRLEFRGSYVNGEVDDIEQLTLAPNVFYNLIYNGEITKVYNHINFFSNDLFCEWAWCINLDKSSLDCYAGTRNKFIKSIPFSDLSYIHSEGPNYFSNIIYYNIKSFNLIEYENGVPVNWDLDYGI
jgi:hypothetical protein